jgi:hypothetical protein
MVCYGVTKHALERPEHAIEHNLPVRARLKDNEGVHPILGPITVLEYGFFNHIFDAVVCQAHEASIIKEAWGIKD